MFRFCPKGTWSCGAHRLEDRYQGGKLESSRSSWENKHTNLQHMSPCQMNHSSAFIWVKNQIIVVVKADPLERQDWFPIFA